MRPPAVLLRPSIRSSPRLARSCGTASLSRSSSPRRSSLMVECCETCSKFGKNRSRSDRQARRRRTSRSLTVCYPVCPPHGRRRRPAGRHPQRPIWGRLDRSCKGGKLGHSKRARISSTVDLDLQPLPKRQTQASSTGNHCKRRYLLGRHRRHPLSQRPLPRHRRPSQQQPRPPFISESDRSR